MGKKVTQIKVVTHFDPEDEDCGGDYCGVSVFVNGKCVRQFGDYYHDKGCQKAEAVVDMVKELVDKARVRHVSQNDADCYCAPDYEVVSLKEALGL